MITGSNYESLCHHCILFDCSVCESLSLDNNSVVGKVVLCFTTVPILVPPTLVSSVVKAAGGVGVIIAQSPRSILAPCSDDFPCIVVDYELGTEILFYIRATRYVVIILGKIPMVHLVLFLIPEHCVSFEINTVLPQSS